MYSSCCPALLEILPRAHPQSPHSVIIIHKRGAAQSAESQPAFIGQNSQLACSVNSSYSFTLEVKYFAIPSKQNNKTKKSTRLPVANSHQSYPAGVLWLIQTLFFPSPSWRKPRHSTAKWNTMHYKL